MTEKLIPLAAQAPGQTHTRMNLETGAVWYSPAAVADYIAEAIMRLRAEQQVAWDALPADVKTNCAGAANPMLSAVSSLLVRLEHAESAANAAEEELAELKAPLAMQSELNRKMDDWIAADPKPLVAPPDERNLRSFLHTVLDHGCRYGDRHDPIRTEQFCAKVTNEYLAELLEMLGEPRPLVALTDEQISSLWDSGRNTVVGFTRLAIAAHCRLNGLTEPKP